MNHEATALFDFSSFPTLTTHRLTLRQIMPDDADAIFTIRGDYAVTRYNIGAAYDDVSRARTLIDSIQHDYDQGTALRWGITYTQDVATVMGMVGFNYWDQTDHRGSVGFDLARAYWRRGIMSEALRRVIVFGFTSMGLNRIEADASIYNTPSLNLLQRLGFQREGVQREQYYEDGRYHDLVMLALLKREWIAAGDSKAP